MIKKNNIRVLILELIVIACTIVGITFAITYVMKQLNINATGIKLAVDYSGVVNLPNTSLYPINDEEVLTNTENVMTVEFSVKGAITNTTTEPIIYDVILSDLNVNCELRNKYLKWRLYKNNSLLNEGTFSSTYDLMADNKLWLTNIQQDLPKSTATADNYKFVLWISEACPDVTKCSENLDQSYMLGQNISGKIQTVLYTGKKKEIERKKTELEYICPNSPDLIDGLVPITYSENKWVKADSDNNDNSWYDYNNQKWANAVLVKSDYRDVNNNDTFNIGEQIPEEAILAYYVWVPRYKYKVWNINKKIGTDSYKAKTSGIEVVFENKKETTGTITCNEYDFTITNGSLSEICNGSNGEYYTHPAFTFGEEPLNGLWVSKFEISPPSTSACYSEPTTENCNNTTLSVRIKPNANTWRINTLSNYSTVIQNMQITNNEYGLTTDKTKVDSHMIKNMEWGAVAYLTHSQYGTCINGTCEEVNMNGYFLVENNYNNYKTGCGPQSKNSTTNGSVCNEYNTELGQLASTTGNVYGIYDMSGGVFEYVMGNMSNTSGRYNYYTLDEDNNFTYLDTTKKYIDTYAYANSHNSQSSYNKSRLGDSTGEVVVGSALGWNLDYSGFVNLTTPWFVRSGDSKQGDKTGIFLFYYVVDTGYNNHSTRAILTKLN